MNFFIIGIAAGSLIVLVELLKRYFSWPNYISRKITHIGSAGIALWALFKLTKHELIILCIIFAVILLVAKKNNLLTSLDDKKKKSWGELFFPIGVVLSAVTLLPFEQGAFFLGILILGISDSAAGLIGEYINKKNKKANRKSLIGTLTFFTTSIVIITVYTGMFNLRTIVVAAVVTIIEFSLSYGLDNLFIPISVGLLAVWLL